MPKEFFEESRTTFLVCEGIDTVGEYLIWRIILTSDYLFEFTCNRKNRQYVSGLHFCVGIQSLY